MKIPNYNDQLLNLAEDLGRRLLPVFDTPTGVSGCPFPESTKPLLVNVHESTVCLIIGCTDTKGKHCVALGVLIPQ